MVLLSGSKPQSSWPGSSHLDSQTEVWSAASCSNRCQLACMSVRPCHVDIQFSRRSQGKPTAGLVVLAVLVTVLVTAIGILAIASRVASSRQGAAAGSLTAAARQAAEFGYSEITAELNREVFSHLLITRFGQWAQVSNQDLLACGIAIAADSIAASIPAIVSSDQTLPNSPSLSYRLIDFQIPMNLDGAPSQGPQICSTRFGNLLGGTAVITIQGTAKAESGDITHFTLKRGVSVKRLPPIFNNPLLIAPSNRPTTPVNQINPTDYRFPSYREPPQIGIKSYRITCKPDSQSKKDVKCIATNVDDNGDSVIRTFKSANSVNSDIFYFPFVSADVPWSEICLSDSGVVRCRIASLEIKDKAVVTVGDPDDPEALPVEIYLDGDLNIEDESLLSGYKPGCPRSKASIASNSPLCRSADDLNKWTKFRIYDTSGSADPSSKCSNGPVLTINKYTDNTTSPAQAEPNLQHAFVWLKAGKVRNQLADASISVPALVGWACSITNKVEIIPSVSTLPSRYIYSGLGGAYEFQGIFRHQFLSTYRAYGFVEQTPSRP